MILRLNHNPTIENLRHCPAETVEKLRSILAAGAPATADPHRKDFYDVQDSDQVFYIHICPSGRVLLLAAWEKAQAAAPAPEQESLRQNFVAAAS